MAYEYVPKAKLKPLKSLVNDFFRLGNGKDLLKKYKCYYRLVGSSKRNLVLYDESKNEGFDLDYQIIFYNYIESDSNKMISIKNEFRFELDKYLTKFDYKDGEDSTTAITYKKVMDSKIITGFDFVLMMPMNDYTFATFRYSDSKKTIMQLAKVRDSQQFNAKYKEIKGSYAKELRNMYREEKNKDCTKKSSFSLLVECVNRIFENAKGSRE